jgi:hypothetical protein
MRPPHLPLPQRFHPRIEGWMDGVAVTACLTAEFDAIRFSSAWVIFSSATAFAAFCPG